MQLTTTSDEDSHEIRIIEALARFSKDPLGFVYFAFDWGHGELAEYEGPDQWHIDVLKDIRDGIKTLDEVIRVAVSSGHGIGKTCLVAWLILWGISTCVGTRGVVTANTDTQLKSKVWSELQKWYNLFIAKDLFVKTVTAIFSADPEYERTWRIDAIPWSIQNTEAFAGLHNQGKRILVIFDEASAIDDRIWDVTEGALTDKDTQILWYCGGNPTRSMGRFFDCFNRFRHRWKTRQIDSRTVKITNKAQLKEWEEDYGIDSDFFKVRVRGIFPSTSDRQFIGTGLVDAARGKHLRIEEYSFAPIIIGVDPAWMGDDEITIVMRQGNMSKVLGAYRKVGDDFIIAGHIARFEDELEADQVFIDAGYGHGIYSAGRQLGRKWRLVEFAGTPTKGGYLNKRAEMWGEARDWLKQGGVIPDDPVLCQELTGPEYQISLKGLIQLEKKSDMKKRGCASPNRADALALTFAFPVRKKDFNSPGKLQFSNNHDYDPYKYA